MLETTRLRLCDYYNWPQVVMGKYIQIYRVDPGSKKKSVCALVSSVPSRRNSSPAGQHKRGPFGSPVMGEEGSAATVVSAGTMYICTYRGHNNNNITYIVLCTLICTKRWTECPPALYLVVRHVSI